MSRISIVLLVLVITMTMSCSGQKPRSPDVHVADGPMVGDKWVMIDLNIPELETAWEVTAVEMKDGAIFVTALREQFRREKSLGRMVSKTKVSDDGKYLLQEGEQRYDPPIRMNAPVSIKEGDSWELDKPGLKLKFRAGKEEEVEVPAGKFKARRIDGKGESDGKPTTCTLWQIPGRHPTIKSAYQFEDGGEVVEVLKSFTPGKK